jgi:hypothetical protein
MVIELFKRVRPASLRCEMSRWILSRIVTVGRTWISPPRSGPSLQPQSHSVHHRTGFSSSSPYAAACDILESGRGNGSGGRLACGVAVRGGGERGSGRSRGAGAQADLDTFVDCDDNESVVDVGASSAITEAEAPMSDVTGSALTNNDEVEPGVSENGSLG